VITVLYFAYSMYTLVSDPEAMQKLKEAMEQAQ
jgi:hypothetical protein